MTCSWTVKVAAKTSNRFRNVGARENGEMDKATSELPI